MCTPLGDAAWPSCTPHAELGLLLTVYVDDISMAGIHDNMKQGRTMLYSLVELDPPTIVGVYLGYPHHVGTAMTLYHNVRTMAYGMEACIESCCDVYRQLLLDAPTFGKVPSPSTPEDHEGPQPRAGSLRDNKSSRRKEHVL